MVYKKVAGILADILNLNEEDITPDMRLTPEPEIEKIHIAKLVIECERKFKITIHDEKVQDFCTVKDLVEWIEHLLAKNEGNLSESTDEKRMWWYYQ